MVSVDYSEVDVGVQTQLYKDNSHYSYRDTKIIQRRNKGYIEEE